MMKETVEIINLLINLDLTNIEINVVERVIDFINQQQKKIDIIDWINVSERLPEDNQEVITFDNSWGMDVVEILTYSSSSKNFSDDRGETDSITHWKPKPESPKVK